MWWVMTWYTQEELDRNDDLDRADEMNREADFIQDDV